MPRFRDFGVFVFDLGCFVFEFWVLRFRDLGASFSSLGCFVFDLGCFVVEFRVLRFRDLGASFSSFGCFVLRSSFSSVSFSKLPSLMFIFKTLSSEIFLSFQFSMFFKGRVKK